MPPLLNARQLARQFADYSHQSLETFVRRFMPNGHAPGFVGGVRFGSDARADLICLLGALYDLGYKEVAGHGIEALLVGLLALVDGEETETFQSYRIAETLLRFGSFTGNPLLRSLTDAQHAELAWALDTTHIYEGPGKLRGLNNNFWAVLARSEFARQRLGLLPSSMLLDEAIQRVRDIFENNPCRFFDDSPAFEGRYDIYTAETLLFMQPMAELLGRDFWRETVRHHTGLLSQLAMENGASFTWGRSIGLYSIYATMELAVMGVRQGAWDNPALGLSLAQHAFHKSQQWFTDGLSNAHQHRSLSRYRRVERRAQMTLDCWIKLVEMAEVLIAAPKPDEGFSTLPRRELFPSRDVLIPLDDKGAAVWSYRNGKIAFHYPVVHGPNGDYVPWFRAPGYLENPVDTHYPVGAPRVVFEHVQYTTFGHASLCEKFPDGLRLVYDSFQSLQENHEPESVPGRREVRYQIGADGSIEAEETWSFAALPEALSLQFAESGWRFQVEMKCDDRFHAEIVDVSGIAEWRSYWDEINRIHEFNFAPAMTLSFSWKLQPAG
jgi:hypothetical protein